MKMNEHIRDVLMLLGLTLASFGTMFIAKNELIATQNRLYFIIIILSAIVIILFLIFGIFSLLEMIKGWRK